MSEEYALLASSVNEWIVERELLNYFQIMEDGVPKPKLIKKYGEHIKFKDPFQAEFKWKEKVVLRFKGTVDMITAELTIGVERTYLNACEPFYYKFRFTPTGVEMI